MKHRWSHRAWALLRKRDPARLMEPTPRGSKLWPAPGEHASTSVPGEIDLAGHEETETIRPHKQIPTSLTESVTPVSKPEPIELTRVFSWTCSKDLMDQSGNEDASIVRMGQGRAAIFDGASESFAARRWARLLAHYWGRSNTSDWLAAARSDYLRDIASLSLTWAQEAAVERGSYSTITAITVTSEGLDILAIGDSCLLLLRKDQIVWSYPLDHEDQFTSAPQALSTRMDLAAEDSEAEVNSHVLIDPSRVEASALLLATDAISAWLLASDPKCRTSRLTKLAGCRTQAEFVALVAFERAAGHLKVDDCTVVGFRIRRKR